MANQKERECMSGISGSSKKDGTRAYVSIHAVPIFQDGVLTGAQASIREILPEEDDLGENR